MSKITKGWDHAHVYDELWVNGTLAAHGSPHEVIGEVEIIHTSKHTGKTIFTRKLRRNDLLVSGAVFLSEKVNNMRSTFLQTPIDMELGVHRIEDIDRTSASVPLEQICGIMVGNGGCGDTYNTVHKVHRTDRVIPGMLPLRVVPIGKDLEGSTRMRY